MMTEKKGPTRPDTNKGNSPVGISVAEAACFKQRTTRVGLAALRRTKLFRDA
jgi:hypothetical protein